MTVSQVLQKPIVLLALGIHDVLTTVMAEQLDFETFFS